MLIKVVLFILFISLSGILSSAERNTAQKRDNAPKRAQQKTEKQASYDKRLFDPALPRLKKEQISSFFKRINDGLLTLEFPPNVKQAKRYLAPDNKEKENGPAMSTGVLASYLFSYKRLIQNWELEEVTRTKKEYFNIIGRDLLAVMSPLSKLETAVSHGSETYYKQCVDLLETTLDGLDKDIKNQKKYQLSSAELRTIQKANTERRKVEIEKLMKKLGVGKDGKPLKKKQGQTSR